MRGPIDFIVVGFEGNKFNGGILEALKDAVDKQIISVIAVGVISKSADGTVTKVEASQSDEAISEFIKTHDIDNGTITEDDISEVAELLENNTTAGLLVVEQLWAKPLKQAIVDANGVLLAEGRIHPDAQQELSKEGE